MNLCHAVKQSDGTKNKELFKKWYKKQWEHFKYTCTAASECAKNEGGVLKIGSYSNRKITLWWQWYE